ncbi:MAG: hypothetical protein EOP43_01720 [Sphingobacteriaceae bacterium]|nr:MAG: hypothetical protein EOP43_01720 [Sphingobacteriaceae bacterium]
MKIGKGVKVVVVLLLQVLITSNIVYAQGLGTPCNGGDPDVDCPIDSWILAFTAIAVIYTCIKIKRVKTVSL